MRGKEGFPFLSLGLVIVFVLDPPSLSLTSVAKEAKTTQESLKEGSFWDLRSTHLPKILALGFKLKGKREKFVEKGLGVKEESEEERS